MLYFAVSLNVNHIYKHLILTCKEGEEIWGNGWLVIFNCVYANMVSVQLQLAIKL